MGWGDPDQIGSDRNGSERMERADVRPAIASDRGRHGQVNPGSTPGTQNDNGNSSKGIGEREATPRRQRSPRRARLRRAAFGPRRAPAWAAGIHPAGGDDLRQGQPAWVHVEQLMGLAKRTQGGGMASTQEECEARTTETKNKATKESIEVLEKISGESFFKVVEV